MSGKSTYQEQAVLNTMNGQAMPAWMPYVALFTAPPSQSSAGTEVIDGVGYARVAAAFGTPTGADPSSVVNTADVVFGVPTGNWGTPTHFGLYDAATSGNLRYWGEIASPVQITNGQAAPSFLAGALVVRES